jgi:D-glycero-D-manno-heptose 1,7-bisphosphate phosphatase
VNGSFSGTVTKRKVLRPAAFFDRDGTLNEDSGYPHRVEQLRWLPGAREAIRMCNDAGYYVFVVTNQSGIARGYFDECAVNEFHDAMQRQLAELGAHVDAFAFCPHLPNGTAPEYSRVCDCRKPAPGMLLRIMAEWPVDAARSFLLGDHSRDVTAANAAGIEGVLCSKRLDLLVKDVLSRHR